MHHNHRLTHSLGCQLCHGRGRFVAVALRVDAVQDRHVGLGAVPLVVSGSQCQGKLHAIGYRGTLTTSGEHTSQLDVCM